MASQTSPAIQLSMSVDELPQVSARRGRQFKRLGIRTVSDLLRHVPLRYEREHAEGSIADLPLNEIGSARGTITAARWVPQGGGFRGIGRKGRFEATLDDGAATLLLTWFHSSHLRGQIHPGMEIRVQGKTKLYGEFPQMVNPRWERLDDREDMNAARGRHRPVYPATEDLGSAFIERLIAELLPALREQIVDPLEEDFVRHRCMPDLGEALRRVHMPADEDEAHGARRRLAYNECLLVQLGVAVKRHYNRTILAAPKLTWNAAIDTHIRQRFPFHLTGAQDRVVRQIAEELQRTVPMNRLVQGDVGSGKTVVALYALLMAVADRKQGALMAPTELLAEQHHMSICQMLTGSNVGIELLTSGRSTSGTAARTAALERIESGQVDLVIGTQALLTESVRFRDLAVVVTDEQHRFGVLQRARLRSPAAEGAADGDRSWAPHNLVMTATPIPRTLSLVVFGDLDVSTIDELPPGRAPVTSRMVTEDESDRVYGYLADRVATGEQAYVVVPTIDSSGQESAAQLKSVRDHARLLKDKYFPQQQVEAIHGRLKRNTRQAIMDRFRDGKIHVLVATTVIEVGVDVPNATLMVVEHAERFGLAQLHQLRGRIGRGTHGRESLCVFVAKPATDEAEQRMEAIRSTTDGFQIAEHDLQIRGMGDFFGTRQHGAPPLRIARIPDDLDLLQMARRDAEAIVGEDPSLERSAHRLLRGVLVQQYGDTLGLIDVG